VFAEIFTKRGSHNKTAVNLISVDDTIGLPLILVLIWYLSKLGALNFDKSEVKQKSYGTVPPTYIFNSLF
jgi:hypothetical protein